MAVIWRNNGEKVDGLYYIDVDPEDGSNVQTFSAATRKEVSEKLATAQFNASRAINTLKRERKPEPVRVSVAVKPLDANERMQFVRDIQDPEKFDQVIERVVEARFGVPVDEITRRVNKVGVDEVTERQVAETKKFVAQNADWYPTQENKMELMRRIEAKRLALTAVNFGIVWDEMKAEGKADLAPEQGEEQEQEEGQQQQPPPPSATPISTTRPRTATYQTGVRPGDFQTRRPAEPAPKYTRAQIENMPPSVYREKLLHEPGFEAIVNKVLA